MSVRCVIMEDQRRHSKGPKGSKSPAKKKKNSMDSGFPRGQGRRPSDIFQQSSLYAGSITDFEPDPSKLPIPSFVSDPAGDRYYRVVGIRPDVEIPKHAHHETEPIPIAIKGAKNATAFGGQSAPSDISADQGSLDKGQREKSRKLLEMLKGSSPDAKSAIASSGSFDSMPKTGDKSVNEMTKRVRSALNLKATPE